MFCQTKKLDCIVLYHPKVVNLKQPILTSRIIYHQSRFTSMAQGKYMDIHVKSPHPIRPQIFNANKIWKFSNPYCIGWLKSCYLHLNSAYIHFAAIRSNIRFCAQIFQNIIYISDILTKFWHRLCCPFLLEQTIAKTTTKYKTEYFIHITSISGSAVLFLLGTFNAFILMLSYLYCS